MALTLIVHGGVFPVAGTQWSQLCIIFANWGQLARNLSHQFIIGVASEHRNCPCTTWLASHASPYLPMMLSKIGQCLRTVGANSPHLKRRKPPSKKYLHSTGTKDQASMYGAPYIALGTTIASGNTHLQAATGHEALGVRNSRVRRERGTKKSAHTGTKAGSKVLCWPRI